MSKTKRLSITNPRDTEQSLRQIETWANVLDDVVELRAIDDDNNPIDVGNTIYIGIRLSNSGNKLVILRKDGDTNTEIGTVDIL